MTALKTSLAHLPARKQEQLAALVQLIRDCAPVEMIILYGSHARGDWVDDPVGRSLDGQPPTGGFFSDYDVLVVVEKPGLINKHDIWAAIEDRAERIAPRNTLHLIVHDIRDLNYKLEHGWYFFTDIAREGILLYDSGQHTLATPKPRPADERRQFAQEGFDKHFRKAELFYTHYEFGVQNADDADALSIAAFLLHQAAENYYKTVLLVFTAYIPAEHNIEQLGKQCAKQHPGFRDIFPRAERADDDRFKQLKKAYVEARYSRTYSISRADLEILATHVRELRERTLSACREHLDALAAAAAEAREAKPEAP